MEQVSILSLVHFPAAEGNLSYHCRAGPLPVGRFPSSLGSVRSCSSESKWSLNLI